MHCKMFKVMLFMSNYSAVFNPYNVFQELYKEGCSQASLEFKPAYKGYITPLEIVRLISYSMFMQFAQF